MGFELKDIKGLYKIVLLGVVGFGLLFLFLNFLPWILLIALVIWGCSKLVKYVKSFRNDSVTTNDTVNYNEMNREESYTNGQVIDVDYEEVK